MPLGNYSLYGKDSSEPTCPCHLWLLREETPSSHQKSECLLDSDSTSWDLGFELPASETEEIKFCCYQVTQFTANYLRCPSRYDFTPGLLTHTLNFSNRILLELSLSFYSPKLTLIYNSTCFGAGKDFLFLFASERCRDFQKIFVLWEQNPEGSMPSDWSHPITCFLCLCAMREADPCLTRPPFFHLPLSQVLFMFFGVSHHHPSTPSLILCAYNSVLASVYWRTWTNTVGNAILIDDSSFWLEKFSRKHILRQEDPFWYFSLKCAVFVICTCSCVNVDAHVSIWASMWRQVANIRSLPEWFSTLFSEAESLTKLKTHWLG